MSGFVYVWTNSKNNKKYIGSHKGSVDDGYIGSGKYFKRAYKLNPNNFSREILYIGDDYVEIEDLILKTLDVKSNKKYYNLINSAYKGWYACYSEESRAKLSEYRKGKKHTEETKLKMSKARSGVNNCMYGKKHSTETRNKISQKKKGVRINNKRVIEVIDGRVFDSVSDCASHYGISQPTMSVLIRGERINKGKCKNKIFRYEK
jgi:group I intron endonuclease